MTYWCAEQVCAGLQELDCFLWAQTGALLRPNGTEPWTSAQALHLFGAYSTYLIQPAKTLTTHLGPYFGIGRLFRVPEFRVQVSPPALISTDAAELDVTVDAPDTAPDATIEDAPNNPAEHPRRAEP